MNDRLIYANKLKAHYAWWNDETKELFDSIVDAQPTVYAIDVIRCMDCKHYVRSPLTGRMMCTQFSHNTKSVDYCSYGERKGEK